MESYPIWRSENNKSQYWVRLKSSNWLRVEAMPKYRIAWNRTKMTIQFIQSKINFSKASMMGVLMPRFLKGKPKGLESNFIWRKMIRKSFW